MLPMLCNLQLLVPAAFALGFSAPVQVVAAVPARLRRVLSLQPRRCHSCHALPPPPPPPLLLFRPMQPVARAR
jgi:hypothetical protein